MGKVYVRVDDRLIHGQTIVSWGPTLGIKEIIGIDDVSAQNPMLKSILTMGVPKNYKTQIVSSDDALKILSEDSDNTRLVIVKFPSVLEKIKNVIKGCEVVYLGNIAKREDTTHQLKGATGIFYLSDNDISVVDDLVNSGFKVCFQQVPNASKTEWADFKKQI